MNQDSAIDDLLTFPSIHNCFNSRRLDFRKLFVQRPVSLNITETMHRPQSELGQQTRKKWLREVIVQGRMRGKLRDLTTTELLNRVVSDVELAPWT
jgi:hypothetical protein